ncbi:MAG: dihydropteroate synthase [Crocinitomicaceae bacterium]|jgi:dihydropteroate synthase|tara:strand:- start:4545 stop:5399 length:855 start_codon:yes stop_codon:yes gene_type:complete
MYTDLINPLPKTINIKGTLFQFDSPKIMGIINLSPDSFFENDAKKQESELLKKVAEFIDNGADIIDIGGSSTKPNSVLPSVKEELKRVVPALKSIRKRFSKTIISIDTARNEVAREAIKYGADIVNDVSGGFNDDSLLETVSNASCPYILTHNVDHGINNGLMDPSQNTIKELIRFFSQKISELNDRGIYDIIIDPGFGFSKNTPQNYDIIKNFELLHILDAPILVGVSRKSMIYNTLDKGAQDVLNGSSILHAFLISKNASIFRVHDVKEMNEVKKLWEVSFS